MRRKIIGVTVGTPISPKRVEAEIKPVKTIDGKEPDMNGNVDTGIAKQLEDINKRIDEWHEWQAEENPSYSMTIDSELSLTSENPVQNKVVTQEFRAFNEVAAAFNERLSTLEKGGIGGEEYEIPTFDLVELGLPTIIPNGQYVRVATDTAEIIAALEKGAVKIIVNFNMGAEVAVSLVLNPASMIATGEYSCTIINEFNGTFLITTVNVANGFIAAKCTLMDNIVGGTAQPTAIDLSGLETNGTIVETYADGTTKTTSIEFDANGTPTKITDGDGNVTTLTW